MSKIEAHKCDKCGNIMQSGEGFTFAGYVGLLGRGGLIGNKIGATIDTLSHLDYCVKCTHEIMFRPLGIQMSQTR